MNAELGGADGDETGLKNRLPRTALAAKYAGIGALALIAAGCVETVAQREPAPPAEAPRTNMARREGYSPRGASVSVAAIQGISAPAGDRLAQLFDQQARLRDINLTEAKTAHYLVKGYLSALPAEGGATYSIVWDIYDAKKRAIQIQRIDDRVFVKGASAASELVDDAALTQIASKSADELAAVLTNMPEAIAAVSSPVVKAVAVAPDPEDGTTNVAGTSPDTTATPAPRASGIGLAAAYR